MADIKDLFNNSKSNKILTNTSISGIGDTIESADFVKSRVKQAKKFIPSIDFTTASNFAFYGSAEKYYTDSINYITNEYPYDGSEREKIDWELSGTYLDKYFFDNLYPKTNGYVNIGQEYGTVVAPASGNFSGSSKDEYIKFYAGPNQADGYDFSKSISQYFSGSNVYATGSRQESNIDIDGTKGFSVEFWLKKDGWSETDESTAQVIFDISKTEASPVGRLTTYIDRTSPNVIKIEIASGSVSEAVSVGSNLPITGNTWNHYAVTFKNSGADLLTKTYLNGELNSTTTVASAAINRITGSIFGYIGALTGETEVSGIGQDGYGKLSGSLDDFRIWKTERSEKQIKQNWFTSVNGGANTDYELAVSSSKKYDLSKNVDLGIYYKFNEGILNSSSINSQDAVVLDYAGRSSNGAWTGYSATSRETGSAMVLSNAASFEPKDPIIYSTHPSVVALKTKYEDAGKLHDAQNNSALYWSLPSWITSEEQGNATSPLRNLTQILGSYFDNLQMQISNMSEIKERTYKNLQSGSNVSPYMSEVLRSFGMRNDEILSNATNLEYLASRNERELFEKKINETKNLIYSNIYNNLSYIYKSKGTEKSFRNLIRCFGIDDEIVNVNLYGNNSEYLLRENETYTVVRKNTVDFFDPDRFDSVVYLSASSSDTDAQGYIKFDNLPANVGSTFECESHFKPNPPKNLTTSFEVGFLSSSIFGSHTHSGSGGWASPDYGNFQVYSVRKSLDRDEAFFVLTGTAGGFMPELTSSVFKDVYDNSKWNFSLRVYPEDPFVGSVSGSSTSDYTVRFTGYQYSLDVLVNSFDVTSSISNADAINFLQARKVMFVGAHRTNFTSTVLQKSNAQISSCRVWAKKLEDEQLKSHAKNPFNYGVKSPGDNQFISISGSEVGQNQDDLPDIKTLALNWDFETITGSNSGGQFVVPDYSSGSAGITGYGFLNDITQIQHPGLGISFPASSTDVVETKFVNSSVQKLPEVINSSNMVSVISQSDEELFTRETRPTQYYFSFEKSMYSIISKDILNFFSTIKDFNNLIGEPVNRYRPEYKQLEKLRQIYFSNVENDLDFEKFVEYYKWIDSSIATMLVQLVPASSNFMDGMNNVIESHVLERNKYWSKFPTAEEKRPTELEAQATSPAQVSSPYSAPQRSSLLAPSEQDRIEDILLQQLLDDIRNREKIDKEYVQLKLKEIAKVIGPEAASKFTVPVREALNDRKLLEAEGKTRTVSITSVISESPIVYDGGSNTSNNNKHTDYTKEQLELGSDTTLSVPANQVKLKKFNSTKNKTLGKGRTEFKFQNSKEPLGYLSDKGSTAAPFGLYSSSVESGYVSQIRGNFNPTDSTFPESLTASIDVTNYHDDSYGEGGIPVQGPFTQEHVGGKQYRHQGIVTTPQANGDLRAEGWNLQVSGNSIELSARTYTQARATQLRDGLAKRPVNIQNIKYNTGSQTVGNYQHDYEIFQTVGRTTNDRYAIKTEYATPTNGSSSYVKDLFEYELPRYDLTGTNKSIFVERFSAPGGPETTAGGLNVFGAEYSVYNTINYRNLAVRNALDEWYTEHAGQFGIKSGSSVREEDYNTNAAYHKTNRNPRHVVKENNDCAVTYDNWWLQHAIPQSAFQYAWITSSVSKSACDTFGYVTPFTSPSGSTSVTQSALPFIAQSSVNASDIFVDFVGLNTLIIDPINPDSNILSSSTSTYKNTDIASISDGDVPNSLFVHRNGPYGVSSWSQLRNGDSPIIRYHNKNNTLSVSPAPSVVTIQNGSGSGQVAQFLKRKPDTFKNFTEPPVSFKNKPLKTKFSDPSGETATIQHEYSNKKQYFSQPIGNTGSISDYIGFIEPESKEMYDNVYSSEQTRQTILNNKYGEVIYPRDARTGLAQTRTRVNYAETATVTDGSASFSTGSNGIDRGPLLRRSIWRDNDSLRNRRIFFEGVEYNISGTNFTGYYPDIATTLPNSQGFLDASATSIYGLGRTPLTFWDTNVLSGGAARFVGQALAPTGTLEGYANDSSYFVDLYSDTGELNSANWQTIAGYIGISSGSGVDGTWANKTTFYPTASAYYYHRSKTLGQNQTASLNKLAWRTAELSGKNPWYDSYEDYTQDISKAAKNFTIIPEFKISDHMKYYSELNFRKNNDKFLILNGANVTSSANTEEQSDGSRLFNEEFFNEYSNTDFQQYFGKFSSDLELGKITLTCNGVKKLLPYNGFYPSHRTLQLASLFSQSLGPHIGGLGWNDGSPINSSFQNSGALAVQSMLQPYFAPGILYNTIKSGIAVDWAAYTGSNDSQGLENADQTYGFALGQASNYRIPFESILDPLSNIGFPVSSSDGEGKLQLLYPTYTNLNQGENNTPRAFSEARRPFAQITDFSRAKAISSGDYNLYRLGINNFLAETSKFFLENQELKSISSKRQEEISLVSGTAYYMDVVLEKDPNVVMIEDYLFETNNGQPTSITQFRTYNGQFFGPPTLGGSGFGDLSSSCTVNLPGIGDAVLYNTLPEFGYFQFTENAGDPLYAPYTPPYFYGKSKATIKYIADDDDEKGNFNYKKLFEKATVTYGNEQLKEKFTKIQKRSDYINWVTSSNDGSFVCSSSAASEYFVLSRSSGGGSWNFGATSANSRAVGEGQFLEWKAAGSSNKNRMVGLNNNPPAATTYTDMEYAIHMRSDETLNIFENGVNVYSNLVSGAFSPGDWFRILIEEDGTVKYQKSSANVNTNYPNGNERVGDLDSAGSSVTLFKYAQPGSYDTIFVSNTSSTTYTTTGSLYPDVSMQDNNAAIAYAQVSTIRQTYPAEEGAMQLSSSLNTFGILTEKQSRFDDKGNLIEVVDDPAESRNRWIISPKMETPILDFSNQPRVQQFGRGMWSGYGQLLTSSNGVTFGIEETFKNGFAEGSGSLVEKCFDTPQIRKVGEIADIKKISEAIVAIPYSPNPHGRGSKYAETTPVLDRNFFRIKTRTFDFYKKWYEANKNGNLSSIPVDEEGNKKPSESITKMLSIAGDYVLPPEIDFMTYDSGRTRVNPFAMYVFEFNHYLDSQDLADIWQGVMPKISTNPEFSDPSVDNNIFSHATGKDEFFHGKQLPPDTRWMVFKIKKRAGYNYFEVTPTNSDDEQFNLAFSLGKDNKLKYSYNWPYDFFSLVELAQVETENTFVSSDDQIDEEDN
jgi:hypothetical protein